MPPIADLTTADGNELDELRQHAEMHDGVFIGGRAANHKWGTRSPAKLAEMGIAVEPHYDEGKHCYWLPLGTKGEAKAARLGLTHTQGKV